MVIEPSKQDLFWWQPEKLVEGLIFFKKSVEFRMQFDVNLSKESSADDLPDQTKNEMLPDFNNIAAPDVYYRTSDTFCGIDDYVVVFSHMERIQLLDLLSRPVQHTLVNGVWNAVVDEFGQNQSVFTLVEHLEGVSRERKKVPDVRVTRKDCIDMSREFGPLIFIDSMCNVR